MTCLFLLGFSSLSVRPRYTTFHETVVVDKHLRYETFIMPALKNNNIAVFT